MPPNREQIMITVPSGLGQQVDDVAEELGITRSELCRTVLVLFLNGRLSLKIDDIQGLVHLTKVKSVGRPRKET